MHMSSEGERAGLVWSVPGEVNDELLGRYNVNDYAASVKVYAIK